MQAEILNLIKALKEKTGLAVILITHDLTVVRQFADHVYVMQHARSARPADRADIHPTLTPLHAPPARLGTQGPRDPAQVGTETVL